MFRIVSFETCMPKELQLVATAALSGKSVAGHCSSHHAPGSGVCYILSDQMKPKKKCIRTKMCMHVSTCSWSWNGLGSPPFGKGVSYFLSYFCLASDLLMSQAVSLGSKMCMHRPIPPHTEAAGAAVMKGSLILMFSQPAFNLRKLGFGESLICLSILSVACSSLTRGSLPCGSLSWLHLHLWEMLFPRWELLSWGLKAKAC